MQLGSSHIKWVFKLVFDLSLIYITFAINTDSIDRLLKLNLKQIDRSKIIAILFHILKWKEAEFKSCQDYFNKRHNRIDVFIFWALFFSKVNSNWVSIYFRSDSWELTNFNCMYE